MCCEVTTPYGLLLVDPATLKIEGNPLSGGKRGALTAAIEKARELKNEVSTTLQGVRIHFVFDMM